jgi:uncharacterized protein (TIGR03118 family)
MMRTLFRQLRKTLRASNPPRRSFARPALECLEDRNLLDAAGFVQTALASDIPGVAAHTNRNLINPWGFVETAGGQFIISANGSGDELTLNARGQTVKAPVIDPPPLGSPPGTTTSPNGTVLNTTQDFVISEDGRSAPATVIASTEDGTLVAFNRDVDRTHAVLVADQSATGAVYKLLAMGSNSQGNFLYATDFHNDKIDVFDKNFHKVTLGQGGFDTFTDPNAPAGFAPFGIKDINGTLFVSYAKQDADAHDDVAGAGNGFIDEFSTIGTFLGRFASGTAAGGTLTQLNSPIGMAVAPAGFGPNGVFGGALLVGNFGDSHVSAFNLKTGAFLGQLSDAQGHPLVLNGGVTNADATDTKGLWGIGFGNGKGGTDPNALYFATGVHDEADGVFGKVTMTDGDHDRDDRPGRTGSDRGHSSTAGRDFEKFLANDVLIEALLSARKGNR